MKHLQIRPLITTGCLVGLLSLAGLPLSAAAQPVAGKTAIAKRAGAKEARAMLDRAVAQLQQKSPEAALAAFNNPKGEFVRGDLYVFVVGLNDGIMHAHGAAPEGLVGMQVMDLRDAAGKALIREMVDVAKAKGSGEVDYVWLNRVTNKVENKTAFVKRVGDNVVGVGYYVPRSSAEQARGFLDMAVAEIARAGDKAAFSQFNDSKGRFVRNDLYVFAVGLDDGRFYAMGANPGLVGTDVKELRDAAGKPIIQEMIALVREKGSGMYEYVWRNPVTNKVESKHSFVRRADGYLVGVGYYTK